MKKTAHLLRVFALAIAALTLTATVLRSLCLLLAFDRAVGYYDSGALPTSLYIVLALVPVTALVYALLVRRSAGGEALPCPAPAERTTLVRSFSLSTVGALVTAFAIGVLGLTSNGLDTLTLLHLLAAALAIPYFAVSRSAPPIWSGIAAVVCCILSIVVEYFDPYVAVNSPIKLMHLVALLSAALYLLTELFALAGASKPGRAVPLAMISAAYGIVGGTSHVIAALAEGILSIDYLARALILYALGLYAAARLGAVTRSAQQNDSKTEEN